MSAPTYKLTITRGKTLAQPFQYAESFLLYRPITAVTSTAPLRVRVVGHGIPDGWPVRIQGVVSPSSMNTPTEEVWASALVSPNEVEINTLDTSVDAAYDDTGSLVFQQPADITGWVFRMHIRDKIGGTVLLTLSSDIADGATGIITVAPAESAFTLGLTAAQTAALSWAGGVYDIEAVRPDGAVIPIIAPSVVVVDQEVTVWL
jgi:hypothetical protein